MEETGFAISTALIIVGIVAAVGVGGTVGGLTLYDVYGWQLGGAIGLEDFIDQGQWKDLTIQGETVTALHVNKQIFFNVDNEKENYVTFKLGGEPLLTLQSGLEGYGDDGFRSRVVSTPFEYNFSKRILHAEKVYENKQALESRAYFVHPPNNNEDGFLFIIGPSDHETWWSGFDDFKVDGFLFIFPEKADAFLKAERRMGRNVTAVQLKDHIAAAKVEENPETVKAATVNLSVFPAITEISKIGIKASKRSDYSDLADASSAILYKGPVSQEQRGSQLFSNATLRLRPNFYYEFSYHPSGFSRVSQRLFLAPTQTAKVNLDASSRWTGERGDGTTPPEPPVPPASDNVGIWVSEHRELPGSYDVRSISVKVDGADWDAVKALGTNKLLIYNLEKGKDYSVEYVLPDGKKQEEEVKPTQTLTKDEIGSLR